MDFTLSSLSAGDQKDLLFLLKPCAMELISPVSCPVFEVGILMSTQMAQKWKMLNLSIRFERWTAVKATQDNSIRLLAYCLLVV